MRFAAREEGQTVVEYALIFILIIIVVILFILVVWPAIEAMLPEIGILSSATATPGTP
jgi:Flp pilus assembly pilin Flp